MGDIEEREALLDEISQTSLIPSLKAQLKMAVRDKIAGRYVTKKTRNISQESEVIDNIILEFLFAQGFNNTASVFFSESELHPQNRENLLQYLQINDTPGLISELLLDFPSHPSISTQTEANDLSSKLEEVELQIRRRKQEGRYISSEEMLRRGIEDIDREFEEKYNNELKSRIDMLRASEISKVQAEDITRNNIRLEQMRQEMEADLRQKTAELRTQYQRDSDILRVKQRELEREISKWAEQNVQNVVVESHASEIDQIKASTEDKSKKLEAKIFMLQRKLEKERRKLEDVRLEHNKSKRELEKIRIAISIYEQNQTDI